MSRSDKMRVNLHNLSSYINSENGQLTVNPIVLQLDHSKVTINRIHELQDALSASRDDGNVFFYEKSLLVFEKRLAKLFLKDPNIRVANRKVPYRI